MQNRRLSPKEILKSRRPERFSDSIIESVPALDVGLLEYHLDTLTNREQSRDFENFARKLLQKTVCPNLIPQTGPTGGGDSKVDSETYPVADSLSFAWYCGEARRASVERWAFAFSAKEDWRPKVRSDIAKLVATNRSYKMAYFVTNQFVRDKERAAIEDELTKKHAIDVRILDRTWIVAKIFEEGHVELAIQELGLSPSLRHVTRLGPLDYQKKRRLDELEQKIKLACEKQTQSMGFVDDCLEAAEVAAGMERPRIEIDGHFDRAQRAAEEFGTKRQKLRVAYQRAWTAYWWYEDYATFNQQYALVQTLAANGQYVHDLQLLHNLWNLKFSATVSGLHAFDAKEVEEQTRFLITELERLSNDEMRPSAAYHADGLLLMMRMLQDFSGDLKPVFEQMGELIETCAGLAGFPFDSLARVLQEIGTLVGHSGGYSLLFDNLVRVIRERSGEIESARLLLNRGAQLLDSIEPVEAIRILGRALTDLYKHETRSELVRALYLTANAYRQLGLLYAARGSMLAAASIATNHFWSHEEVLPIQVACYNRMKWMEVELGRVPQAMDWHCAEQAMISVLETATGEPKDQADDLMQFDLILGAHFLRFFTEFSGCIRLVRG